MPIKSQQLDACSYRIRVGSAAAALKILHAEKSNPSVRTGRFFELEVLAETELRSKLIVYARPHEVAVNRKRARHIT